MITYPSDLEVRPLTTWPGQLHLDEQRTGAPYRSGLRSTVELLRKECRAIDADRPLLEVALAPGQFRADGRPRADARSPEHPGVVLSIPASAVGALRFACDRFLDWPDNLRAICLTMEALRAVERHGAVRAREQYAGFKALPAGAAAATAMPGAITVEQAAQVLADLADPGQRLGPGLRDRLAQGQVVGATYRAASKRVHPDAGGDRAQWDRLEQAKRVLDEHGAQP